jgi:rfaE bifunctional protein nucleotidyltransferase chain/domain/rfaE bifunctional protein kinase chain/domain
VADISVSTDGEHSHLTRLAATLPGLDVDRISRWGAELAERLGAGHQLLAAGNGGSAAEAQHLTAELVGRYERERRPVSAVALHADTSTTTAVANDYGYDQVFARQIRAHARPGDIVLLLSSSGRSPNVLRAAEAARAVGVTTWALTGPGPNPLAELSHDALTVDSGVAATVQECHLVVVHLLAAAVDRHLVEEREPADEPAPASDTISDTISDTVSEVVRTTAPVSLPGAPGRPKIVVVGDTLLDRDSTGSVRRLSPEAPVPVLSDLGVVSRPGGAGLAAALAALGTCEVTLVTALADDAPGELARALLDAAGVRLVDLGLAGPTPVKSRIRAADRTLLMLDEAGPVTAIGANALPDAIAALHAADGILVSDYGRGMTALPRLRRELAELAARVPVVWDPHPRGSAPVPGICLVTPNSREAAFFGGGQDGGARNGDLAADVTAGRGLLERWAVGGVVVTRGSGGAVLIQNQAGVPLVVSARDVAVSDSCGAGDRFASAVTVLLARGALPSEAVTAGVDLATAYVAAGGPRCLAGGPVVPAGPAPDEEDALGVARRVRAAGGTVVAVGGCFDLLHRGHVHMLEEASRLGDCLIVCMNGDGSVTRLKGATRPVLPAADRAAMLRSLRSVDGVLVFDEDTPEQALRSLRPDVFVKGGDYAMADLPETGVMRSWGGQVVAVPFVAGYSTTSLLNELSIVDSGA